MSSIFHIQWIALLLLYHCIKQLFSLSEYTHNTAFITGIFGIIYCMLIKLQKKIKRDAANIFVWSLCL